MADPAATQTAIVAEQAPAPATAPAPAPAEPVATTTPEAVLTGAFDSGLLNAALFGVPVPEAAAAPEPASTPAAPAAAPEPAPEAQPAGPSSPNATPAPEPVAQPEQPQTPSPDEPTKILPSRISTAQFDSREQQAIALRHELAQQGQHITLREAIDRVEGMYAPPAAEPAADQPPAQEPATQTPEQPSGGEIAQLEGEVAELERQIDEAGENQSLFGPELAQLTKELSRKAGRLEALRADAARTAQQQAAQNASTLDAVRQQVLQEYPSAGDDTSYLGARVAAIIADVHGNPEGHPLRNLLTGTDAPRKVVEHAAKEIAPKMAQQYGITEAQALALLKPSHSQAAPAPAQPTAPRPVPRNLSVTAPGQSASPEPPPLPSASDVLGAALANPKLAEEALGFGASWT